MPHRARQRPFLRALLAAVLVAVLWPSPAVAGLVQYWDFDTGLANAVSGGVDGVAVGAGLSITHEVGQVARGSGALRIAHNTPTGDYVRVPSPVLPTSNPTAFSISTWYKFDAALGTQATDERNFLWETFPDWSSGAGLRAQSGARNLEWYFNTTGTDVFEQPGLSVGDGQWHHLAVVWDAAADTTRAYHDGQLLATVPLGGSGLVQPTAGLNIGNHRTGDGSRNWKGFLDDFAVHEGTLDAAGVLGLYTGAYTPRTVPVTEFVDPGVIPTAPLQAYWTFDNDYASRVHNDFYQGQPRGGAYTSITHAAGQFVRGTGALKLDSGPSSGDGTYVDIPREVADVNRDKQITISAWYQYADSSGDGSDTRNFVWESAPGYSLSFGLRDESGSRDAEWWFEGLASDTSGPAIAPGTWNHVVMVLDQESRRAQFYHNGALRDDVYVAAANLPAMSSFHIGNHRAGDGSRDFDGFIDDVAVFHGVLDAEGVAGLYGGSLTPETVPVLDRLPPPAPVEEPAPFVEGSWTLVYLPDTQGYCHDAAGAAIFNRMTQWIVENKEARNIGLVLHGGDITDDNSVAQWTVAKSALSRLDGQVPYVLTAGNHDMNSSRFSRINEFFAASDNSLVDPAQGGILAGVYEPGKLENAYYRVVAPDGRKLLVFSLEFGPRQAVVDWAHAVATQPEYADHAAVLLTHAYLYNDDTLYDWGKYGSSQVANPHAYGGVIGADCHDGQELWDELVGLGGNFEMTFNGHVIGAAQTDSDGVGYLESQGEEGNLVHQMLFNAQHVGGNGGDGWLRLLEFLPDGQTVRVKTYSPYLDDEEWPAWRVDADDWFTFRLTPLFVPGDANLDGVVDDLDASILAAHWQTAAGATWAQGDFNADGRVDDLDASILAAHWQEGLASVPEPSAWVLLAAAAVVLLARHKRRG